MTSRYGLKTENLLSVISMYFVAVGILLLVFQIRSGINYQRRKAATDFSFGPILVILLPLEKRLKELLGRPLLVFEPHEHLAVPPNRDDPKEVEIIANTIDILNFYERMAMSILKGSFDEDMCYDDKGFIFLRFYRWVEPYVDHLRREFDDRAFANLVMLAERWAKRHAKHAYSIEKALQKTHEAHAIKRRDLFL